MHIKTNIETSFIQIVVLAICPILLMVNSASSSLYYICATAVCFLLSTFICFVFNKYMSKTIKIFVTAVISTFAITVFNFFAEKYGILGIKVSDESYFAVLSTIILSVDNVYLEIRALINNFFIMSLRTILVFALLTFVYGVIKEFLSFGTIFDNQIIKTFAGNAFFETLVFDFIFLGVLCVICDITNRAIMKKINQKHMMYEKYVKKIRNEKKFQYDELRRKKLLATTIETNKIGGEDAEIIKEKENENETAVIEEKNEKPEEVNETPKKKKKNKKLKVSKGAKVEKLAEIEAETKEENNND